MQILILTGSRKPQNALNDKLYETSIANDNFKYQYNKVKETEFDSVWLFNFYDGHFAGGIVLARKIEYLSNKLKNSEK